MPFLSTNLFIIDLAKNTDACAVRWYAVKSGQTAEGAIDWGLELPVVKVGYK